MTTDTRPSASALLGRLRDDERARQADSADPKLSSATRAAEGLRRRVVLAALLTAVVLLVSLPDWAAGPWIELVLTTVVVGWCGWPLLRRAVAGLRARRAGRDLPSSFGLLVAFGWAVGALLGDGPGSHFWGTAALTTLLLAGRLVEARADAATREGLRPLLSTHADDVAVLRIDPRTRITGEIRIATDQLVVGDQFVVRTGELVVADGGVVDGSATLDRSRLLGATPLVDVAVGDSVAGGAVSTKGRLVIQARTVGERTLLSRIQRLAQTVDSGSTLSTRLDRFVDRASALLTPVTLVIAAAALVGWLVTGSERALTIAVATLVGASPAALALAIPSALRVATGRSAELGILVKGTEPLEQSRRVDTVVLEQTGVVTTGDLRLRSIAVLGRLSKEAALKAAAAVEQGSTHPIALAIVDGARIARIELPRITDFATNPGEGATARIRGTEVTVGRAALFDEVDETLLDHAHAHGGHTVFVGWDGIAHAALTVEDAVRDSSRAGIERLRELGLTAYLVSGDGDRGARRVAEHIGIEPGKVRAELPPSREQAFVADLQRQGRRVLLVGAGDAPAALEQADLGIAVARGTDVETDAGDVVVLRQDLSAVADAVALSRQARAVMRQNIAGAGAYNGLVLVLAAAGVLHPLVAAALGAVASVVVLGNALRLRGYRRANASG
jgi:Cu+-exporting ATPase